ncbi:MAG: YraN family protein [Paracoccaceae bacterium]|jgi:putative endonuclease|nr:YraN family protein [Paracoccaceae bacterium]
MTQLSLFCETGRRSRRADQADARAALGGKRRRGERAHLGGAAAEDSVARHYARCGREVTERRWRGTSGEIDLVTRDGDGLIFVEVKRARTLSEAACRLTERQIARIVSAASEYLGRMPLGQLTPVRFDLALVDGAGRVEVVENAFGA